MRLALLSSGTIVMVSFDGVNANGVSCTWIGSQSKSGGTFVVRVRIGNIRSDEVQDALWGFVLALIDLQETFEQHAASSR
jgi:hypothetical protein